MDKLSPNLRDKIEMSPNLRDKQEVSPKMDFCLKLR